MNPLAQGPTFLVIGAAKSGTSALYAMLSQHPEVHVSAIKEPHFLAFHPEGPNISGPDGRKITINEKAVRDPEQYFDLFDSAPVRPARGEFSVSTLYRSKDAIVNIERFCPDVRMVAILRHPLERAYSSYNHARRWGIEHLLDFEQALDAEPERLKWNPPLLMRYADLSRYDVQLRPFVETFGSERVMVVFYDDYRADPAATLARICEHIGVDSSVPFDTSVTRNVSYVPNPDSRLHSLINAHGPVRRLVHDAVPWRIRRGVAYRVKRRVFDRPAELSSEQWNHLLPRFAETTDGLELLTGRDLSAWRERRDG